MNFAGLHSERNPRPTRGAAYPQSAGLLVVRSTLNGSPAASELRPGDILLRIKEQDFPGLHSPGKRA